MARSASPSVYTTLTRSDLVAISIGGNDARHYQIQNEGMPGALAGAPAAAAAAVTNATNNLNVIMAHGTPTISFLAGDTGQPPEIAAHPTGAAIRPAYTTAYNRGMPHTLAGKARSGSIVHYLDLTAILSDVKANPAAYGIQNLVCPAFPNPTCVVNSSGYLFYGDRAARRPMHACPEERAQTCSAALVSMHLRPPPSAATTARKWGASSE